PHPASPCLLDALPIFLELIRVAPGAFCTMMLADMGAEVLKIETPPAEASAAEAGDASHEARRAAFQFVNRNKQSMAINLKHPAGDRKSTRLNSTLVKI